MKGLHDECVLFAEPTQQRKREVDKCKRALRSSVKDVTEEDVDSVFA